jgi:adenylate cyclase
MDGTRPAVLSNYALGTTFLQEVEATLVVHDLRHFSALTVQLGPVDLGIALSRYYEHVAAAIEPHGGRLVKFVGDAVMSVFLGATEVDHRGNALEAVRATLRSREAWLAENTERGVPMLDYSIGVASGEVLAGDVGTSKLRFYDVLGEPVNVAFRLVGVATDRHVSHVVTADAYEKARARPPGIEIEAIELGGKRIRLFRLEL